MYGVSGEAARKSDSWDLPCRPEGPGLLAALKRPDHLPSFLTEEDLTRYIPAPMPAPASPRQLNWYRCDARAQLGSIRPPGPM